MTPLPATPTGVVLAHATPADQPPPLRWPDALAVLEPEWLPLLGVLAVGGTYLAGVHRLHRRGDRWPVGRTLAFLVGGLGSVLLATQTALAAYDTVLLWVHMVQHMVLNMLAAIFLALGAPLTLALRALPAGGRARVLAVVHSLPARVVSHPVMAGLVFVANPFVLYFTDLYEATLRHPWLHDLNHVHFVLVGVLWFSVVLGIDPLPTRPPHVFRMLGVFATLPFHAFLGVSIMSGSSVLAGDWYAAFDRAWGPTLLGDQELAGALLWASGDLVALVVLGVLFVQWYRASEREAVREDRRLERLEQEEATRRSALVDTEPSPPPA